MGSNQKQSPNRIFYGWWIVCVCTMATILGGGIVWKTFSVFFLPLLDEFGWSRAQYSLTISISSLLWVCGPLVGAWVDRHGPRKILLTGTIIMGVGFAFIGRTTGIWQYYALFFFSNIGLLFVVDVPLISMISHWFIEKRGLAMGIVMSGHGLGGLILPPLTAQLILTVGWRTTYYLLGACILVILVPMILCIVRQPAELGLAPWDSSTDSHGRRLEEERDIRNNFTVLQVLKLPAFWFIIIGYSFLIATISSVYTHAVPHLQDMGFSLRRASMIMACSFGISIAGCIISGYLNRMRPAKVLILFSNCLMALGIVSLWKIGSPGMVFIFIVLFGFGQGAVYTLIPLVLAEFFGVISLGAIYGAYWSFVTFAFAVGPFFTGYIHDQTGSYDIAFILLLALVVIGCFFLNLARKPRNGNRMGNAG